MSRRIRIGLISALGLALASCASDAPQDTFDPAGTNAQKIQDLQVPIFILAGVVGVIVFIVLTFVLIRFRDKGQAIPEQSHGNPALEIVLTIIPALILIGIAIPTVGTLLALDKTDDTECIINVTGQQWWWEIDYPVQDGCGDGISEVIVTSGQMVIPVGTNVLVRGTSRDVIHSWWIPRLNGKRDMVPGRVQTNRIQADEPGIYAGQCTEFCGLSHANMRMEVVAMYPDDFEAWKAGQIAAYESPAEGTLAAEGEATFIAQCSRCHQINGLEDGDGDPIIARPDLQVYAGAAPNLSWLMSRNTFAGASWDLLTPECRADVWDASPETVGQKYLEGVSLECLNSVDLREWLRDAPAKKPMYTDATELEETGGLPRGMPDLGLGEDQIDQLVAYLLERQ
ncbi:MAG: cytochrome c oxidase subunit II [Actinobacteria bacterium]|nr:MAG: cytochrome c oxidase subunit II [Actinomycetota bacterium]